jgi:hypothetical protein
MPQLPYHTVQSPPVPTGWKATAKRKIPTLVRNRNPITQSFSPSLVATYGSVPTEFPIPVLWLPQQEIHVCWGQVLMASETSFVASRLPFRGVFVCMFIINYFMSDVIRDICVLFFVKE